MKTTSLASSIRIARACLLMTLTATAGAIGAESRAPVHTTPTAKNDWAEGTAQRADGASRDYYNRAGLLKWKNFMGDWRDAANVAQGNQAYASTTIIDNDEPRFVEWDVTKLVAEWTGNQFQNQGMFLRSMKRGATHFCSREHRDESQRPQLVVTIKGRERMIRPSADTSLDSSTYRSLGNLPTLRISGKTDHTLLRFDLKRAQQLGRIDRA